MLATVLKEIKKINQFTHKARSMVRMQQQLLQQPLLTLTSVLTLWLQCGQVTGTEEEAYLHTLIAGRPYHPLAPIARIEMRNSIKKCGVVCV